MEDYPTYRQYHFINPTSDQLRTILSRINEVVPATHISHFGSEMVTFENRSPGEPTEVYTVFLNWKNKKFSFSRDDQANNLIDEQRRRIVSILSPYVTYIETIYARFDEADGMDDPLPQYQQQGGSVSTLRTLCNQKGISCRDKTGKFLSKSELVKRLRMMA